MRNNNEDIGSVIIQIIEEKLHRKLELNSTSNSKDMQMINELISKGIAYDQVAAERDIAIGQLEDIGCSFGMRMDNIAELIKKGKEVEKDKCE